MIICMAASGWINIQFYFLHTVHIPLLTLLCNRHDYVHNVTDFFSDKCSNKSVNACSEFRTEVPLSEKFNLIAFDNYCR